MLTAESLEDDDVQCALVEYVRGIKARKWTLQLGQTYDVGRAGGCVDVEVDHPSLSRKHCTLAITQVDSELILVALDHGSTNGTFINKSRLEKGEGVKMPVADVKHIVFGECPNGYKFLVKDQEVDALPADGEESMPVASKEVDQREQHVDAWARGPDGGKAPKAPQKRPAPEGGNRKERRAAMRAKAEAKADKSKSAWRSAEASALADRVKAKHGGAQGQNLNIELRQQSLSELKLCMQHQQEEAQRREEHVEEQQAAAVSELHRDMEQLRSWIQDEVAQRVDNAEGTVRYFQDHFVRAQELSESTFHRKVTWMVRSVTPRLRHAVKSQGEVQCFVSPELHFAGQRLVLELQLPAVEDLEAFLAVHGPPPAAPLPGVCAVRIWARPGIRLACLVALGDSAVSGGRAAEHLFPEPGPVSDELGRVPWQIAHVGEFFQSWDRRTDSLTVSLEVLEMRVPPPERPPWPPTNVIEEASPSANGLHPADELSYTNHLAGEALVQERVSADLRRLWSLGTRRMEWTLEGCSRLLQRAQPGHFVESPFFACAGLEGLSLRLYPRGAAVEADSGEYVEYLHAVHAFSVKSGGMGIPRVERALLCMWRQWSCQGLTTMVMVISIIIRGRRDW
eukprot:s158_g39.t3